MIVEYDFNLCLKCPHLVEDDGGELRGPTHMLFCNVAHPARERSGRQFPKDGRRYIGAKKYKNTNAFFNFVPPKECPYILEHLMLRKEVKSKEEPYKWW